MTTDRSSRIAGCRGRSASLLAASLLLLTPPGARAESARDPSVLCDDVAVLAARETGVPLSVLKAISLNETGRKRGGGFRPWPWTVNMEGKGLWFDGYAEAKAYVDKEFARGARSFDVGCFQINYKWHGDAFSSIEQMFDPLTNALYAARLLKELHAELGNWGGAAGAYHSRTKEYADRYQARFERLREPLIAADGSDIPEIPDIVLAANGGSPSPAGLAPRVNTFPLLRTGGIARLGSLVPLGESSASPLMPAATPPTVIE